MDKLTLINELSKIAKELFNKKEFLNAGRINIAIEVLENLPCRKTIIPVGVSKPDRLIPIGSKIYSGDTFVAEVVNILPDGYIPKPNDFNPPLGEGTVIDNMIIKFNDKVIYKHPNFIN